MKSTVSLLLCGLLIGNVYAPMHATAPDSFVCIHKTDLFNNAINTAVSLCIGGACAFAAYKLYEWYRKRPSQFKILKAGDVSESFDAVAGNTSAKEALLDIVTYLKNPALFHMMGASVPKGVLLQGPPGTGKTLLARALAGEAYCSFIAVSGSEFIEVWAGLGAARVRALFEVARAQGPCIIFIDEIDALIRERSSESNAQEANQTLNEFLKQLDGFEQHTYPLIVVGATNRIDIADPAVLRPGRFDRIIYTGLPTIQEREDILAIHIKKVPFSQSINLTVLAERTAGFSGADLAHLVNEAAIHAIHQGKDFIEQSDLEKALDKMLMGSPHERVIPEEEKRIIAYHEAGHALAHLLLNEDDPYLHKISIIARGHSGGHTAFFDKERSYYTKQEFKHEIMVGFGGRAAEQLACNTVMTGPAYDIYTVTHIARAMICSYGMSEKIGPVSYHYYPDRAFAPYSESTLAAIDQEVKAVLEECYNSVLQLLTEHRKKLDAIALALIEKEELSAQEVMEIIKQVAP